MPAGCASLAGLVIQNFISEGAQMGQMKHLTSRTVESKLHLLLGAFLSSEAKPPG